MVCSTIGVYRTHVRRLTLCVAKNVESELVRPADDNAVVKVTVRGVECVAGGAAKSVSVEANSTSTNANNTSHSHNTTTNNVNIFNVHMGADAAGAGAVPLQHFPQQDMGYMTPEFKAEIARLAAHPSGFNMALEELFKVAYFNPSRAYNMNVFMAGPGDTAIVRTKDHRWEERDGDRVVKDMIVNQTEAIDTIRSQLYDDAKVISKATHDKIEATWDALETLEGDERIRAHVKDRAMSFTDAVMGGGLGSVAQGLAMCRAVMQRQAAAAAPSSSAGQPPGAP